MKKYIIGFILGAIVFGSIGVVASTVLANNIEYKQGTVKDALDTLYNKTDMIADAECISGSFVCTTCNTESGQAIPGITFTPKTFITYWNDSKLIHYYNYDIYQSKVQTYQYDKADGSLMDVNDRYVINNKFVFHNFGASRVNQTIYYIVCG